MLVVDDHALFRRGLVNLLSSQEDIEVVGEGENGLAALRMARELAPDVVLMDIAMPVCDGLEATRLIKAEMPSAKIVILTVSDSEEDFFRAIRAGVSGYLLKDLAPQELYRFIRSTRSGAAPVSVSLASKVLVERVRQMGQRPAPEGALSDREREVLELVALGTTNRGIAAALSIAENTVKNHVKSILEKLHVRNRVEITAYAIRQGLLGRDRGQSASPKDVF